MGDPAATILERVAIFGALKTETLAFLLLRAETVTVQAGEFFFREGDCGDGVYVLQWGQAAVEKDCDGTAICMGRLEPGTCFGEIAVLAMIRRTASVRAISECAAIRLGTEDIHALFGHDLEQFTLLVMNLGREVCRRLQRADEALFRLSPETLKTVHELPED